MATFEERPTVTLEVTLRLSEQEAGALQAIAGYGVDPFLEVFYEHLGRAYLKEYEAGLRSLFNSAFQQIPGLLRRAQEARDVFSGVKRATISKEPAA